MDGMDGTDGMDLIISIGSHGAWTSSFWNEAFSPHHPALRCPEAEAKKKEELRRDERWIGPWFPGMEMVCALPALGRD